VIQGSKLIEFDDVRDDLLVEAEALISSALASSQESANPNMIHMCGIPGSGKTTYAKRWNERNDSFAVVQFDGVMEKLSGYRNDRNTLGLAKAFRLWELPARSIGYHLFQSLIENRRNVFFDHSATSKLHIDLIRKVKEKGYFVEMHYIDCPPKEAAQRVRTREKIIQRHTPEHLIYERYELLKELLPIYQGAVDKFVPIVHSAIQSLVFDGAGVTRMSNEIALQSLGTANYLSAKSRPMVDGAAVSHLAKMP
jgi:predicted ABC-type ATPase